jgi:hypothetical protein
MGHKAVWWDAMARPGDVAPGAEEAAFRASMREIATESVNLLRAALPPAATAAYPGLFSLEAGRRRPPFISADSVPVHARRLLYLLLS